MTSFSSVGKTGRGRGGGEGLFYWFLNIDAVCCICIMFIFRTFPWRRFHLLKCDIARIFPSLAIFDISQISHRPPNSRLKTPSQHEQDSFDKIRNVALAQAYRSSNTVTQNVFGRAGRWAAEDTLKTALTRGPKGPPSKAP